MIIYLKQDDDHPLFDQANMEEEPGEYVVEHATDRAHSFIRDVIAFDFNDAKVTVGYNYSSNGAFHYIFRMPMYKGYVFRGNCRFKVASVSNCPVGSLTFNVYAKDHNQTTNFKITTKRILWNLNALLTTGALDGHTAQRLKELFSRFFITYACSRGGASNLGVGGAQFYTWRVGPFDLTTFLQAFIDGDVDNYEQFIEDKLATQLEIASSFGLSEGADNSDIADFHLPDLSNGDDIFQYRRELFLRRIDEVTVRFLPRNYREGGAHQLRPINYRSEILKVDKLFSALAPIPVLGDARAIRLDPQYANLDEDDLTHQPGSSYQFIQPSQVTLQELPHLANLQRSEETFNSLRLLKTPGDLRKFAGSINNPSTALLKEITPAIIQEPGELVTDVLPNIFEVPDHVGCPIPEKLRVEAYFLRLTGFWAAPFDMDDNDCFLRCLSKALNCEEDQEEFANIREWLGIGLKDHINLNHVSRLANRHNQVYHIWNIIEADYESLKNQFKEQIQFPVKVNKMFKKMHTFTPLNDTPELRNQRTHIHFLWHNEHCYLIQEPKLVVDKVKCKVCTQWLCGSTFNKHSQHCEYCTTCRKSYSTKNKPHNCSGIRLMPKEIIQQNATLAQELVCTDWVPTRKYHKTKSLTKESEIWLADIETFPDPHAEFSCCAYAISIQCLARNAPQTMFFGPECMENFLGMLSSCSIVV